MAVHTTSGDEQSSDDWISDTSDESSETCEDDRCSGPLMPIWHCADCDSFYCDDCWFRQGPHKPNKKGRDGVPHEQSNPRIVRNLKAILNPTRDPLEIQRMHDEDAQTKWFGISRDLTGRPSFEDYGRYATLMSSISPFESLGNRYPQLVSFIGVTNAGKSTLIKLLVNHETRGRNDHSDSSMFPSPIVGSVVNDSLPTSGDVHLYADPATHAEQLPILYADCEGFEGGEATPLGANSRRRARSDPREGTSNPYVHSRTIEWANTEEQRQREYTVTALYPRLLYTFSDCVVFVLRNPKTFQSAVLTKLLDWGVAALEKSINQPALPHCIVALNGTDPSVDDREWNINFATQKLLSSIKGALDYVEGVPRFIELVDHWRSLGKHIYTVEDLILRYYSSFKVVRIPSKPRYMTINLQVQKLHEAIKINCEESFRAKRRARMLSNADELNVYLQSGFDHFTTHLNVPFNFMQISLLRNPIPNDFGGHILQLCTTITSHQPNHQQGRVTWMFEKLSVMLSSCVLLDCARFRKGQVDQLFINYEKFFDYAFGEFLELHYPCSYVSADGTRQCMLVKARHLPKGHQDENGIIAAGDYQAAFGASFLPHWKTQLRTAMEGIHRDFTYELEQASNDKTQTVPEEKIALDLHLEHLNDFFEAVGPASSLCSHATCFCCLMDVPEQPLPCGHVFCMACIKAYGKQTKELISLSCCPLHRASTKWARPALIRSKPTLAGVRILSLDGGGIRGIVQLEVLRGIEQAIGFNIPIQSLFDLIVGTGTGGMIALALSQKDRTVESCVDMFRAICEHSYTPHLHVPVVNQLVSVFRKGPKYKTKPMYAALKTAFSEEDDLFGRNTHMRTGARVAMAATSVTGRESILLASYRRPQDILPTYVFERPHEPEMELKVWQSVAAGLATPSHFKPFTFNSTTYLDGGLRSPNPCFIADRERRLIWPDVDEPDLFLSLGTGQHRITVLSQLSERARSNASIVLKPGRIGNESRKRRGIWGFRRIDDVIDAEIAWVDFRDYAVRERSEVKGRRFIRFNPDLDRDPPASDSKRDIDVLQSNIRKRIQTPHRMAALRNVAHRLIASCFYLDLQSKATGEKGPQSCHGIINCRLEDGSSDMRGLGRILESVRKNDFQPYFRVNPESQLNETSFRVSIPDEMIRAMTTRAIFRLPTLYIPLRDASQATSITLFLSAYDGLEPEGFPISGFPRVLLGEQKVASTRSVAQHVVKVNSHLSSARSLETDPVSFNGHSMSSPRASSSGESWRKTQAGTAQESQGHIEAKMTLAEIIADSQGNGTSIRQRTNRFWTYIGNNHMARHPELYTEKELARFAAGATRRGSEPTDLTSGMVSSLPPDSTHSFSQLSLRSTQDSYEREREANTRDVQPHRFVASRQYNSSIHPIQSNQVCSPSLCPGENGPTHSHAPPQPQSLRIRPARQHTYQQATGAHKTGRVSRDNISTTVGTEFEEDRDPFSDRQARQAKAGPREQAGISPFD
ncbi:calcium-independent phospholipase a2-gamma [Acrodontium crateriforme]|uniref:Calcium-independent phospholipase a2-gamma n=1 Tax=Acrodontium crateriforme TaxID=150365 RepID=A0AAQ3M1Q7_9PEZI|nr:calcium-independent phospholipase a2-gamma [Acrodontium crateriforme]